MAFCMHASEAYLEKHGRYIACSEQNLVDCCLTARLLSCLQTLSLVNVPHLLDASQLQLQSAQQHPKKPEANPTTLASTTATLNQARRDQVN